jgi:hypothetical protein
MQSNFLANSSAFGFGIMGNDPKLSDGEGLARRLRKQPA